MAGMRDPGELDRRITIEQRDPAAVPDELNKLPAQWVTFCKAWARVSEVDARDRLRSPGILPERAARMVVRHRSDITSAMRVNHDGALWEIRGLAELPLTGRRRQLEIFAVVVETPGKV